MSKSYGKTSPISLAEPTPKDLMLTQKVMDVIKPLGAFESKEEMELKQEVLRKLNQLVKDFVRRISIEKVN